jgi:hypothetical protein
LPYVAALATALQMPWPHRWPHLHAAPAARCCTVLLSRVPQPNTDGIDVDSSSHVLIERCDISCGDDHIAIKSGMNEVARQGSYAAHNITVRHNTFRLGFGVAVGSETAGGVRVVRVHHNTFVGAGASGEDASWGVALHVKSAAQRGGIVSDVHFHANDVHNATALMRLASFGKSVRPVDYAPATLERLLWTANVFRARRRVRNKFVCPAGALCRDVRAANNTLPPDALWQCVGVTLDDVGDDPPSGVVRGGCAAKSERARGRAARRSQRRNAKHAVPGHRRRRRAHEQGGDLRRERLGS